MAGDTVLHGRQFVAAHRADLAGFPGFGKLPNVPVPGQGDQLVEAHLDGIGVQLVLLLERGDIHVQIRAAGRE